MGKGVETTEYDSDERLGELKALLAEEMTKEHDLGSEIDGDVEEDKGKKEPERGEDEPDLTGVTLDQQAQAVAALTDHDLRRFLRARKGDVPKACAMIRKWALWAHSPIVGTEGLTPISTLAGITDPKEQVYIDMLPHANHGFDKQGHPLYWEKTGVVSSRWGQIKKELDVDELVARHVRQQELATCRLRYASRKFGKNIERQVIIFDMSKLSYKLEPSALRAFRRTLRIDEQFYPERLANLFFINTPMIFRPIWAMVRPWIDPVTAAKFHILGSDYIDTLREHIDEDVIPVEYGGTNESTVWGWPYSEGAGCTEEDIRAYIEEAWAPKN